MGLRDRIKKRLSRPSKPAAVPSRPAKQPIAPPGAPAAPVAAKAPIAPPTVAPEPVVEEAPEPVVEEAPEPVVDEAPAPPVEAPEPVAEAPADAPRKFRLSDFDTVDAPKLADHAGKISIATGEGPTHTVRVHNPDEGIDYTFEVEEGEFILDAADRNGFDLPYSCRAGGCLVCSGRRTEGEAADIEMDEEQYVLEDEDIEQGFILLCCTTVRGPATFLSHQQDNVQE